ncbi:MAG TPA: tetratricopeptide repeat protein, partial [bacterium]|nr:tetratricopeptide repeat protein [bacterium]
MNVKREISDRALEKGKECLKEEEYSQALTCFRRAHKLNPSGQDVLFEIGKVEFVLGKYAQARGVFEALLAGKYDNSHVRIFLAKIYNQLSQSGKVLQLLEPWIAAGHYGPELHKELGKAYLRTGNTASALVQFRQAEKEGGDGLNWEWATLYRSQGKYRQAIKQLREFLKKGKDREKARVELGKNYFGLREFEKAGKEFREALRVKPDDGHIHAELGLVYEKTGFIGKAVESFETAWQKGIRNEFVQSRLMDLYRKGFAGQGSSYRIRKILEEIHRGDLNAFARNEIENEVEITEQKNFLSSKPRSLIVTLTTACNLDCLMCGRPRALWDLPRKTREEIKGFFPYLN